MMISILDVFFTVVILYFVISSGRHGFLKEVFGKLAFLLGFIGAVFLCGRLVPYLDQIVRSHILSVCLSFMLIFIVIFLFVKIFQMILSGFIKGEIMKSLDHALGILLGLVEGVLIVCLCLILIKAQPWIDTSNFNNVCLYWDLFEPNLTPFVDYVGSRFI